LLIFLMGSLLCVWSNSFTGLLLGRLLQGIGMSAPAILDIVILIDDYPPKQQAKMMGLLNGAVTAAMAFAPLLGSYVNQYFGWRGSFQVLLILSIIALVGSYLTVNPKPGDKQISLSPKAYWPLLCHRELLLLIGTMCFFSATYWSFVALSSLLYIEALGVSVQHFGFYQGTLCGLFSLGSFLMPKLMTWFTEAQCMRVSLGVCLGSFALLLMLAGINVQSPWLITLAMCLYSVGMIVPCNVLYPRILKVIENSEVRAGALVNSLRLLVTSLAVSLISYFYDGSFRALGLGIGFTLGLGLLCIRILGKDRMLGQTPSLAEETA